MCLLVVLQQLLLSTLEHSLCWSRGTAVVSAGMQGTSALVMALWLVLSAAALFCSLWALLLLLLSAASVAAAASCAAAGVPLSSHPNQCAARLLGQWRFCGPA
jgi:hypothetical protein